MGIVYDCLWSWQQEFRQVVHEKADHEATACTSSNLPTFDTVFTDGNALELPPVDDNWFPSLLSDASLNFLPESQGAVEDLFWV